MITPAEFVSQWGSHDLVRNTEAAFHGVTIPDVSRRFLVDAGLPRRTVLDLSFDRSPDELPRLWTTFKDRYPLPPSYDRYLAIGVGYVPIICLDEQRGGRIFAVDVAGHHPTVFMSSSVPQLAQALLAWREAVAWAEQEEPTDEQAKARVEQMEQRLSQIDPEAMQDEDGFWPDALRAALI